MHERREPGGPQPRPSMNELLGRLAAGRDLSLEEMEAAVDSIMEGAVPEGQIALFLTALRFKGETVDEVAGAASALRRHMTPIRTVRTGVLDTCGTGGDRSGTFNISTAAALVAAAAGVPVAKHGNRRVTSRTGSADVLEALGVNVTAPLPRVEACLDELGVCFCFAPLCHAAMKYVAPVRARLGTPTIFNLLGPLANPAGARRQLVGVGEGRLRPLLAEALARLGAERALVVHGRDGLDEVTLAGPTDVSQSGWGGPCELAWTPEDFGLAPQPLDAIRVSTPQESAAIVREVLGGRAGPARDVVVLNAAAALFAAGRSADPAGCAALAAEAIDSGAAEGLLAALVERTR